MNSGMKLHVMKMIGQIGGWVLLTLIIEQLWKRFYYHQPQAIPLELPPSAGDIDLEDAQIIEARLRGLGYIE